MLEQQALLYAQGLAPIDHEKDMNPTPQGYKAKILALCVPV